jgi:peptidyl-tRNA hydrolase, PTH1 family
MSKFLVAGLGNIGSDYAGTRHNIGFDVAEALAIKHGAIFQSSRLAEMAAVKWKGKQLIIIKPTTFVNLSGRAVKYWMDKEKIPIEQILVIIDEIALPISKIRLLGSGSDGGHNGLKSIQEALQTTNYPRLRFGIGNNYPKGMQVDFVLGRWWNEELPLIQQKVGKCIEVIESFVTIGIERTMNEANKLEFIL